MIYKVGDEVLVKANIIAGKIIANTINCYRVSIGSSYFDIGEDSIIPIPDMTAEEAWEIAREIETMRSDTLLKIFDTDNPYCILQDFSPQQAKAKIEAWEAEKEIKIGDEVEFDDTTNNLHRSMIVTSKFGESDYCGICKNGDTYCAHVSQLKKTGRHIDIDGILKQIGGTDA